MRTPQARADPPPAGRYYAEEGANESFRTMFDGMWWAVTALTTVGYGDIYPVTPAGRLIGAVTAFLGIGFFALPAAIIGSGFVEVIMDEKQEAGRSDPSHVSSAVPGGPPAPRPAESDECLVLAHAAAALRRQDTALALTLIEQRLMLLEERRNR